MKRVLVLMLSALMLCAVPEPTSAANLKDPLVDADLVFAEQAGLVAIEAEHFFEQTLTQPRAWYLTTRDTTPDIEPDGDASHIAGASGGAYLELLPDTRRTHADKLIHGVNFSNEAGKMAVLSYKVHFSTPGIYYLWARVYSTNTEDNGLHFGLNGQWPATAQRWQTTTKNRWHWESKQRTQEVHSGVPGILTLTIDQPGIHTLHVSMREDGIELDKILLVNRKDYRPEGLGPGPAVKTGTLPPAFPWVEEKNAPLDLPLVQPRLPDAASNLLQTVAAPAAERPNILFIAVDDLRPQLGCYGQSHVHSPNIDRLAADGVLFERAYCMVPTCGASRASLMTGIRPTPKRFVGYLASAEKEAPGITTLNTHFKLNGYNTVSNGKVFHQPGDNAIGWSEPAWRPRRSTVAGSSAAGTRNAADANPSGDAAANRDEDGNSRGTPYEISPLADDELGDGQVALKTIEDLQRLKEQGQPFFLAAGFFKPHLPFIAPKKYWDLYPADSINLPANYHPPKESSVLRV